MERISIRNLERRFNFVKESTKLMSLLVDDTAFMYQGFRCSMLEALDNQIPSLHFSGTSLDIHSFFDDLGFSFDPSFDFILEDTILMFISLWYNSLYSIGHDYRISNRSVIDSANKIMRNIIENMNYKMEVLEPTKDFVYKEYILLKRDVDVDSVLEISTPDERIWLLSYLDFRVENDYEHKVKTIRHLYTSFEQERKIYKSLNSKLESATGSLMNKIRHKNINRYSEDEVIKMCDKAFYMYIQLKRTPLINEYIEYSNSLNAK